MKNCILTAVLGVITMVAFAQQVSAQTASPAPVGTASLPLAWPRTFEKDGNTVVIYQPQVDSWDDRRTIHFRAAVFIRKKGDTDGSYAAVTASATTWVDQQNRTVLIGPRHLDDFRVPGAKPQAVETLRRVMQDVLPDEQTITIELDRLIAALALGEQRKAREAAVSFDPPVIYASQVPAILVTFAGKPRYQKVPGLDWMYSINTNWDLFFDAAASEYALLANDCWLTTKDPLKGPWTLATRLPPALSKLPVEDNWNDVRENLALKKPQVVPAVFTSTLPAELIVTAGPPQFEPIKATRLMRVSNSDSELFYHAAEQQYYVLAAGRWFRAKELGGPWKAATKDLPSDFASIPDDDENAAVLASVPGTQQAAEAVVQATIPQTAVVNRKDVTISVVYQGDPRFVIIEGTTVEYATNTPYSVFLVEGKYYCCHDGIWFISPAATGPWAVATVVPAVIYTIPATHPLHNVTYVYVYDSTPETVVVGVTGGYSGQYVAAGVVLFGAGIITGAILADDDACWYYHYHTAYFSYGCGVYYSHYHGGYYYANRAYCGPYGGAGSWAVYNPQTGGYARGAYRYGPRGTATAREAYNPWTGNYGARVNVNTPYGSWGRSVITNGDDWVKAGHRTGPNGGAAGIVTSEGTGIIAGRGRYGEGTAIAKDKEGDVYVGHDGNIYKRDADGNWSKRDNGQWDPVQDATPTPRTTARNESTRLTEANQSLDRTKTDRPAGSTGTTASPTQGLANKKVNPPQTAAPGSRQPPSIAQDLSWQAQSRDRGMISTQEAQKWRGNPPSARPNLGAGGVRPRVR